MKKLQILFKFKGMKKAFTLSVFTLLTICSFAQIQHPFNFTGAEQIYTVPSNITSIRIDAYGAQGATTSGGEGGHTSGELAVTPGQQIYIYVGGQGTTTMLASGATEGGWNGGGAGGRSVHGGSGGGASDIRIGGNTLNDRIIVAGGGGGFDQASTSSVHLGGAGGPNIGGNGFGEGIVATGGTQSAGGVGGMHNGHTGGMGTLGQGGDNIDYYNGGSYIYGGGGGGGYYGGAGGNPWSSGSGGSSYLGATVTNGTMVGGGRKGNGRVVVTELGGLACMPPSNVQHTLVNPDQCNITWSAVPAATKYDVLYRLKGSSGWNRIGALNNYRALRSLMSDTIYQYRVRSFCGTWDAANATAIREFNTANIPNVARFGDMNTKEELSHIKISPNPANSTLNLQFYTESASDISFTITDVSGRLVYQNEIGNIQGLQNEQIDVSHLNEGYYIIMMQTNHEKRIEKLLIAR